MHGMLSAAVMLAGFAVTALAGVASVVWLYRVEAAGPRRSRAPRQAGPVAAAAPDDAADDPGAMPAARLADDAAGPDEMAGAGETAGADTAGALQQTVAAGRPIPDWDHAYDVPGWPDPGDDSGAGGDPDGSGPRPWPDARRSLYSRGWPAMDSSPRTGQEARSGDAEPGDREPAAEDAAPASGTAELPPGSPAQGARVYVLGEARRRGR